jgi:hypothetical protein
MMEIDALQGAEACLIGSIHAQEAPAYGSAPSRAGETGAQLPGGACVGAGHQANGTDDSRGSERPWRRLIGD